MKQTISYDDSTEEFLITITVPKTKRGTYTYDPELRWEVDNVCVWIDNSRLEYALSLTQYLDYKDSLQATAPICFFDSQKEAEGFARKHNLTIEYSSSHNHGYQDED